jgi:hypothetical protein
MRDSAPSPEPRRRRRLPPPAETEAPTINHQPSAKNHSPTLICLDLPELPNNPHCFPTATPPGNLRLRFGAWDFFGSLRHWTFQGIAPPRPTTRQNRTGASPTTVRKHLGCSIPSNRLKCQRTTNTVRHSKLELRNSKFQRLLAFDTRNSPFGISQRDRPFIFRSFPCPYPPTKPPHSTTSPCMVCMIWKEIKTTRRVLPHQPITVWPVQPDQPPGSSHQPRHARKRQAISS